MKEQKHIQNYQLAVIIASSLLVLLLLVAWIRSGPKQEWKGIQKEYLELNTVISDSITDFSLASIDKGILQYDLRELNRTDRCITCHQGMENPYMAGAPQPHTLHPGEFLQDHPPEKYGCTICHSGQGKALNKKDAFGREQETHWTEPMLSDPFLQSSCGKCHLSVFSEQSELAGTEIFQEGHKIFNREGCLGCHKARGLGGIVGPDLTEQGEKTKHDYSFQNIQGEQTISNWLKEHFKDPEMVSPGSQMLKIDLPEEDLEALTTFVLGLAKPEIAFEYFSLDALNEFKGQRNSLSGEQIFSLACSGCHGKQGGGKSYVDYETGAPAIMNPDFRRVASREFIGFTIEKGRSTRQMASWMTDISGLRDEEINDLAAHLKSHSSGENRMYNHASFSKVNSSDGEDLFKDHCATCHGEMAKGGIAVSLNKRDFLSYASNVFLYKTLLNGRGNTAMPSWSVLSDQQLHALVKYIKSLNASSAQYVSVNFENTDPVEGELRYHFLCSRCHGEYGQGQTGPALINRDFLEAASDGFLHQTISKGRSHTAMFGWSTDVYNDERLGTSDIGNIVSYLRLKSSESPAYIYAGSNPGNMEEGKPLFEKHCSKCHGVNGEGPEAPALNNQEFLSAASNGYLIATATLGRDGTKMPRWGKKEADHPALSDKERQDIVAYIRSWQRINIKN